MTTDTPAVLVVDDEDAIRETVAETLQDEGYRVLTAQNGAEALELLERHRACVILLDMRMPVMDGWTFARIYHERGNGAPIVVMTAARNAASWAAEIAASAYLAKPFDLDDLSTVVRNRCA